MSDQLQRTDFEVPGTQWHTTGSPSSYVARNLGETSETRDSNKDEVLSFLFFFFFFFGRQFVILGPDGPQSPIDQRLRHNSVLLLQNQNQTQI